MRNRFGRGAICVLGLGAGYAQAADLPMRRAPPPVIVATPVFTWTGPYLGAFLGGVIGDSRFDHQRAMNGSAFTGGLTFGYNYQINQNFVVGLETDIGYRSHVGGSTDYLGYASTSTEGYLGTLRGRVGYTWDHFMVYATGGLAYGNSIAPQSFTAWPAGADYSVYGRRAANNDSLLAGWTVGGGLEYAFMQNWSAKVEYLYTRLGPSSPRYGVSNLPYPVNMASGSGMHVIKAGVNYRFNWAQPSAAIIAKY